MSPVRFISISALAVRSVADGVCRPGATQRPSFM
jgi:hypothetical protein